jgi:hypothetical protein
MGGMFSSPDPVTPLPEPEAPEDPAEAEREERLKNMERRRRGRQGTIQTSWRGLEKSNPGVTQGKQLLGD